MVKGRLLVLNELGSNISNLSIWNGIEIGPIGIGIGRIGIVDLAV